MTYKKNGSFSELPFFLFAVNNCSSAEQERNAPETCKTYHGEYQPAEQRTRASEEPGYQIELKKTHQSPVETTDDGQDQCDAIHTETSISIFG